jgi:hypothetical protein
MVVASVREVDIDRASRVPDETGNPYHRFAAAQERQHLVGVWNVYLLATETRVTTERAQGIVPEPVCIDRCNLVSQTEQMGTQSAPQIPCAAYDDDPINIVFHGSPLNNQQLSN